MSAADLAQERAVERRAGADHRPVHASLEGRLDGAKIAHAAAELDRNGRHGRDDFRHERALLRLPGERSVQVDDVEPCGAEVFPPARHCDRVVGEHRLAVAPALVQANAPPLAQVDGRNDDHRPSFTMAAKFSSMRMPHPWLFSG